QPTIVAAAAAEYPRPTRYGIRCVLSAAVAKLLTKKAAASTQKTIVRAAAPRVSPAASALPPALGGRPPATPPTGPRRRATAWIGIVIPASTTASAVRAARQPIRVSSQASIGMKIVLARPATSVTVSSARSRPRANHDTTTANAGS